MKDILALLTVLIILIALVKAVFFASKSVSHGINKSSYNLNYYHYYYKNINMIILI